MKSIFIKLLSILGLVPKKYYMVSLEIVAIFTVDYLEKGYPFPIDVELTQEQLTSLWASLEKK